MQLKLKISSSISSQIEKLYVIRLKQTVLGGMCCAYLNIYNIAFCKYYQ